MSAFLTISHQTNLVKIVILIELGGPLPGVFDAVRDKGVGAGGMVERVETRRSLDASSRVEAWENECAHICPIGGIEKFHGAHSVVSVVAWGLEPAKFAAILVSPRPCTG